MSETNWLDVVPSVMSAIATVAAAIAAFGSLRVSHESKEVSRLSALSVHHEPAAKVLSVSIEKLINKLKPLSDIGYRTWVDWAAEIQAYDNLEAGGINPRPLRHVLSNASEMLANHGTENGIKYRHAQRTMFCIVRDGVNNLSDSEYESLLQRADGEYSDFEAVFGEPTLKKCIAHSSAFRWAYYQLNRRVTSEQWLNIWKEAWQKGGWIYKFTNENMKCSNSDFI